MILSQHPPQPSHSNLGRRLQTKKRKKNSTPPSTVNRAISILCIRQVFIMDYLHLFQIISYLPVDQIHENKYMA